MDSVKVLFRRVVAFYIDMAIAMFIGLLAYYIISNVIEVNKQIFIVIVYLLLTIFRDISCRSIGKNITKLYIVDANGKGDATISQRILRNITTPIIVFEGLSILWRGDLRKWGDMLAKTEVRLKEDKSKGLLK